MKPVTTTPLFNIGQQYMTRGKHPQLCTVTDIHKTYNSANELVKFRYVATHKFAGQTVADYDVCQSTVAMGAINQPQD